MALSALNVKNGYIDLNAEAHYGNQELYDKWMSGKELETGQVLFTTEAPMGNVAQVPDNKGYILSQRTIAFRVNIEKITNDFLAVILRSQNTINTLSSMASGGTAKGVSQKTLSELNVTVPKIIEEQEKIGAFFKQLDNTITLHQQKYELVFRLKQAYLQLMFPQTGESTPKVRFADFHDSWEQRKLGELSPLRGGFAFKSDRFTNAGIPIVRISNILKDGSVGGEFAYYDLQRDDENYSLSDKSVLLAMSGATTGKVAILENPNNNKVYQNQRVGYFTRKQNTNYSFISVLVRSKLFLDQLNSVLVADAQPNVSSRDIDGFEFFKPSNIEEQQKIGNFFKQLDATLTLHQQKVASLKSLKQAYLQKMFV